jgi:hypothetical protein
MSLLSIVKNLPLALFVLGIFANNINPAKALDDFALFAHGFCGSSDFHKIYLNLRVIRPLVKSYGVISTTTRSPGKTRIMLTRIFPDKWPTIVCPESNWTRKIALGKFSRTLPSSSIKSFFVPDFPKSCLLELEMAVFLLINYR